jgi:hypothetical protein
MATVLVCGLSAYKQKWPSREGTAKDVRQRGQNNASLDSRDVANGDLARAAIFLRVKRDLLAFVQSGHSGALQRGGMDEYVLAAIVGQNETETFLVIVEFDGTNLHLNSSSG